MPPSMTPRLAAVHHAAILLLHAACSGGVGFCVSNPVLVRASNPVLGKEHWQWRRIVVAYDVRGSTGTQLHTELGEMQYQQVHTPCELAVTADDVLNALFGELERQAAPTDGTTPGVCLICRFSETHDLQGRGRGSRLADNEGWRANGTAASIPSSSLSRCVCVFHPCLWSLQSARRC
jgi:hypothetical protein